jgi:hypothetical protein
MAMTIEKLRKLYDSRPFNPFVMHLADGREIPVGHPELMASAPSGRTVTVYLPDDTLEIIDLLLVTDLEIPAAGNGSRRGRRKS